VGDGCTTRGTIPRYFSTADSSITRARCLIDDDHKIYDAKIMNTFSLYRKHNEEPDLPSLLSHTTLGDKRLVTLTPDEADELLTGESSIKIVLQRAWKDGSFKEVRQLGVFGVQFLPISSS